MFIVSARNLFAVAFASLLPALLLSIPAFAQTPPKPTTVHADANSKVDDRPNILVILCDDLGYGDLACYGNPTIKTPRLDQLAAEGLRLTSCYSAAPVCSPSRAGLLTGRTPSRIGIYDWIPGGHVMHLPREEITIATLLRDSGYATCHVGKWHLAGKFNSSEQPQPGAHGFQHWYATQNNAGPSHANPRNFVRNGEAVGQQQGYACQLVADEAINWLKSHTTQETESKQPFFLFACFHEPHEPIASPDEIVVQYPNATKRGEALYYANVTNMDRAVGRLLDALDELQLAEHTLVIFTSDNGPETLNRYQGAWRSHGTPGLLRGMKLHLYEAGIRVPSIIRWPGHTTAGAESDQPVCALDILPTLCNVAGIDAPADRALDGANFLPLLSGEEIDRSTPLYWHYHRAVGEPKAAMRVGEYVILGKWDGPQLNPGGGFQRGDMSAIKDSQLVEFELYNISADISQQHNLAAEQPQKLAELVEMLKKKYREVQIEGREWVMPDKNEELFATCPLCR
jgi:arylsulfatase A